MLRKLTSVSRLSDEDIAAVRSLPLMPRALRADQDLVRQGDRPSQCAVIVDGWAYRWKTDRSGKRQIIALHIPGDMPDLMSLLVPVSDHTITTLSEASVAFIPHAAILELLRRVPSLAYPFWRDTLVDAAVFREWVVNVGHRQATERLAHLFCEMWARLESVGLVEQRGDARTFPWPVTQSELAEASGLSVVHINRTLQELRARGLIETQRQSMTILDWPKLHALADFNADYLGLEAPCARPR